MVEPKRTFELNRRTVTLDHFQEEHPEIYATAVTSVKVAFVMELQKLSESSDSDDVDTALRIFGDTVLTDWNLHDEEGIIPATGDGMFRVTILFARKLLELWLEQVVDPSVPLEDKSTNGTAPEPTSVSVVPPSTLGLQSLSKPNS